MTEKSILNNLIKDFPDLISNLYPFPSTYQGDGEIKAIILGADPTHIVDGTPKPLEMVFGLNIEKTPYWNSIGSNINQLQNISMKTVFVQNVCRNYFKVETSPNKDWVKIAREYWLEHLKNELDQHFDSDIPVLMTTQFILHSVINNGKKIKAEDIYSNCLSFSKDENLLSRELIAFYRHPKYSLKNWAKYKEFIDAKTK